MESIALVILGFVTGYLFDLVSLGPLKFLRPVLWLATCVVLGYALISQVTAPERLTVAPAIVILGAVVLAIAAALVIYALFVNIPFRSTYLSAAPSGRVITTGTYALARHPGVLLFAFVLAGLILVSGSLPLLRSTPLWILLDVLWILIQEHVVFPRALEGYAEYRQTTPMLIPNARSIRAFRGQLLSQKEGKTNAGVS